jgi:hypothetical protein
MSRHVGLAEIRCSWQVDALCLLLFFGMLVSRLFIRLPLKRQKGVLPRCVPVRVARIQQPQMSEPAIIDEESQNRVNTQPQTVSDVVKVGHSQHPTNRTKEHKTE